MAINTNTKASSFFNITMRIDWEFLGSDIWLPCHGSRRTRAGLEYNLILHICLLEKHFKRRFLGWAACRFLLPCKTADKNSNAHAAPGLFGQLRVRISCFGYVPFWLPDFAGGVKGDLRPFFNNTRELPFTGRKYGKTVVAIVGKA